MDLSIDLWHSNNMKVILCKFAKDFCFWSLWTLNYINCDPFLVLVLSLWLTIKSDNLSKLYSWIFKKLHQTSIFADRVLYKISPVCPSICLSIHLWCIFLQIYLVDFLNLFCMRTFCHSISPAKFIRVLGFISSKSAQTFIFY